MIDLFDPLQLNQVAIVVTGIVTLCPIVLYLSSSMAQAYQPGSAWSRTPSMIAVGLMAVSFIVASLKYSNIVSLGLMMFLIATLTLLALIDARVKILPNKLTLPLLVLGLLVSLTGYTVDWRSALSGMAGGFLLLYLPALLYSFITRREGVGFGDFKLLAAIGAWLGWQSLLHVVFVAGISSAVFGLIYLKQKRLPATATIPFGPFLAAASILIILT